MKIKDKLMQFISSLKISYYMSIKALQTLIDLCESIPHNRAIENK